MVDWIAGLGGGAFVLASLVIGGRLMWLGIRSRRLPELAIGGGLCLSGGLGYPLVVTAQMAVDLPPDVRSALVIGHMLSNIFGLGGLVIFTRFVFRPTEGWAVGLMLLLVGGLIAAMLFQLTGPGPFVWASEIRGPWQANQYIGIAVLMWSGIESLLHHGALKKRLALGLADPIIVNRLWLWGLAMLTAAGISVTSLGLTSLGFQTNGTVLGALIVGPPGLVTAAAIYLAFTPPAAYARWVSGRAATA